MLEQKVFWYILDTRYKSVEGHERPGCCVEDDRGHVDFVKCNCILMVFCVLSMICSKGSIDSEKKDLKRWNDLHDVRMTVVPVSPLSPAHCWWYPGPGWSWTLHWIWQLLTALASLLAVKICDVKWYPHVKLFIWGLKRVLWLIFDFRNWWHTF